jgi:hypothetical protein
VISYADEAAYALAQQAGVDRALDMAKQRRTTTELFVPPRQLFVAIFEPSLPEDEQGYLAFVAENLDEWLDWHDRFALAGDPGEP